MSIIGLHKTGGVGGLHDPLPVTKLCGIQFSVHWTTYKEGYTNTSGLYKILAKETFLDCITGIKLFLFQVEIFKYGNSWESYSS